MIAEKLTNDLEALIAQIDEAREVRKNRKANLLKEQPTIAAASELDGINKHLDSLQLAEDVLRDAIDELNAIEEDAGGDPWEKAGASALLTGGKKTA
jgi:hypothetical protein